MTQQCFEIAYCKKPRFRFSLIIERQVMPIKLHFSKLRWLIAKPIDQQWVKALLIAALPLCPQSVWSAAERQIGQNGGFVSDVGLYENAFCVEAVLAMRPETSQSRGECLIERGGSSEPAIAPVVPKSEGDSDEGDNNGDWGAHLWAVISIMLIILMGPAFLEYGSAAPNA